MLGCRRSRVGFLHLSDELLVRVIDRLSTPDALALSECSRRLLRVVRMACDWEVDAVALDDPLLPIARSHSYFVNRDPLLIASDIKSRASRLRSLRLPAYDASMPGAHWPLLSLACSHASNLSVLSFVESPFLILHTACKQLDLLTVLLPRLKHLSIHSLTQPSMFKTLRTPLFRPLSLSLHCIHVNVQAQLLDVLTHHHTLTHLSLSFGSASQSTPLSQTFVQQLASCIQHALPHLTHLSLLANPKPMPLLMLSNPTSQTDALNQFKAALRQLRTAKTSSHSKHPLSSLTLGLVQEGHQLPLSLFDFCVCPQSRVNLYLSDVYFTHAPSNSARDCAPPVEVLAARLSCRSHLLELSSRYFESLSAISICVERTLLLDRWTGSSTNSSSDTADLSFMRHLCQSSSSSLRTLQLETPVPNVTRACHVLQLLSSSLSFACRVSTLHLSADIVRFSSTLLYSLFAQLPLLQHLIVSASLCDGPPPLDTLPCMLHALRLYCAQLQSVRLQYAAYAPHKGGKLEAIKAIRSFRKDRPNVEMHDFAELLELSLGSDAQ